MPAQHGELAGGAGGSDLHATASANALIEGRSGPGAMEADQMAPASMLRAWAGAGLGDPDMTGRVAAGLAPRGLNPK